eukprot:GHVP01044213.1.p1 GENE.GHVP01044213.1~~GHVP01044213.1.p1  ORF type:complete len:138 (+),score=25.96 GHVP01044213.1:48-416(+)
MASLGVLGKTYLIGILRKTYDAAKKQPRSELGSINNTDVSDVPMTEDATNRVEAELVDQSEEVGPTIRVPCRINNHDVTADVDTGANVNLLSSAWADKLGLILDGKALTKQTRQASDTQFET